MKTKILDCTIRDGGHLNNWKFDATCVKAAYYAALRSGIDYFEAGYRYPEERKGLGQFGYCRDELLLKLFNPFERCRLAVMIDAGKCESTLFRDCVPEYTPVRMVRVAAYPYELEKSIRLAEDLHHKGYEVTLNLMASSELTEKEYELLRDWGNKEILSAVYFADSFGSLIPSDIPSFVDRLHSVGFEHIGFHPHNSLQLAFANTLRAIEEGVEFVDASIYGMGRGSGNLPIEILLGYFEKLGKSEYNTVPYLDVIERYFLGIFREIHWGGYSLPTLMSGLADIHPYYVEHLFHGGLYTVDEVWNALKIIKERCPISFSEDKLDETLETRFFTPLAEEKAKDICHKIVNEVQTAPIANAFESKWFPPKNKYEGRKFLIIATGPSILKYRDQIAELKERENCITIGVNNLEKLFKPEFHMFVSRKRFQQYAHNIENSSSLLVPSFFSPDFVANNFTGKCSYFDIVTPCDSEVQPVQGLTQYCTNLNVAVSAILAAYQMGASEIYAVGMDGYADEFSKKMVYFYDEDNKIEDKDVASLRYEMLAKELDRVETFLQEQSVPFFILTPTSHRKYYRSFAKVMSIV